jgi:tryptophan-rich sensory protein
MNRKKLVPLAVAGGAAMVTASVGATFTVLDSWYYGLKQPDWAPPDYMFGVIWTVVFGCIALAGAAVWQSAPTRRDAEISVGLFAFNGFLNLLWSFLFFRIQRPDYALVEWTALWLSIVALIWFCGRFSRAARWLLLPYLIWVSIAGLLNYQVVQLNAPFG